MKKQFNVLEIIVFTVLGGLLFLTLTPLGYFILGLLFPNDQ